MEGRRGDASPLVSRSLPELDGPLQFGHLLADTRELVLRAFLEIVQKLDNGLNVQLYLRDREVEMCGIPFVRAERGTGVVATGA